MCINYGHVCRYVQNINFPLSKLWPGRLSTDNDTNDDDNTQRKIHDCTGSLAFMPNEAIKLLLVYVHVENVGRIPLGVNCNDPDIVP